VDSKNILSGLSPFLGIFLFLLLPYCVAIYAARDILAISV